MEFKTFATEQEASKFVADELIKEIRANKNLKLGLATGSTPIILYQELAKDFHDNKTDWSGITTFNLDEYIGLPVNHEQSYKVFMDENLFSKVNINKKNTYFPEIDKNYDQLIQEIGGIDIQILGIGTNGHIGFNEPGSDFDSVTRVVDLTLETIRVNANKFFNGNTNEVPKTALSMGIGSILKAKKIILLAFGPSKKQAILRLKKSKGFDIEFPASALVMHPNVTIVVDKGADFDL